MDHAARALITQLRVMAFKVVLILSICFQVLAAILALILNFRYRWHFSWLLFSGAAILMAIQRFATLTTIWNSNLDTRMEIALWLAITTSLLVSVLLVGGVALIRPLFREYENAQERLAEEKNRLENVVQANEEEMELARDIQQNLLPDAPPKLKDYGIAGISIPAEWTSGDYYDYIPLSNGKWLLVVADVSGHGAGPALLMAEARALLRSLALSHDDPGVILTLANRVIADDVSDGMFVTMFLVRLDPVKHKFTYAAAGHSAQVTQANQDRRKYLDSTIPPLGVISEIPVQTLGPVHMNQGDILVIPTDGILEAANENRELFGFEQVDRVAKENIRFSAEAIADALFDEVKIFTNHAPQNDDNTVVVLKRYTTT